MLAILQFDSASTSLLARLLDEGRLPTLAGLRERGRWHDLATPATHFAAGAFHTLYSGVPLADHGLVYPFQWSPRDQRARYMTAFPGPAPVWERLSRLGHRTLAIDPYESRPPEAPPTGVFVSGWQLHDRVVLPRWASPPDAHARLSRLFGPPPSVQEIFGRSSVGELLALRRSLIGASARVADAAEHLLSRERFDLVWLTFSAAHVAGHQFWDLSQIAVESLDVDSRPVLEGALAQVYSSVDAAMGRVLACLPSGADVLVVSPVGMGVNTSRADLLPGMLDAVVRGEPDRHAAEPGSIWRLRAAVPPSVRGRVARALPDHLALDLTSRLELRGIDWSRTRAFALPADNQGYVRLNVRGREREGIVEPADAGPLCDEIAAGLATFADPDGTPSVAAVDRVADAFGTGRAVALLPDLVVRWNDRPATALDRVRSSRYGEITRVGGASGRSGNHTDGDAWALVVPGASRHRDGGPARLEDVAATAAAVVAADAGDMAGEPLLQRRG